MTQLNQNVGIMSYTSLLDWRDCYSHMLRILTLHVVLFQQLLFNCGQMMTMMIIWRLWWRIPNKSLSIYAQHVMFTHMCSCIRTHKLHIYINFKGFLFFWSLRTLKCYVQVIRWWWNAARCRTFVSSSLVQQSCGLWNDMVYGVWRFCDIDTFMKRTIRKTLENVKHMNTNETINKAWQR